MTYEGPTRPTGEELERANAQINATRTEAGFREQVPAWKATWAARYMTGLEFEDLAPDFPEEIDAEPAEDSVEHAGIEAGS